MKKTLFLSVLLALFLAACGSSSSNGPKTPQALQPTAVSTALFQVIKPDGTKVGVTVADLKTLPLKQLTVEGKVEVRTTEMLQSKHEGSASDRSLDRLAMGQQLVANCRSDQVGAVGIETLLHQKIDLP